MTNMKAMFSPENVALPQTGSSLERSEFNSKMEATTPRRPLFDVWQSVCDQLLPPPDVAQQLRASITTAKPSPSHKFNSSTVILS